MPSNPKSEWGMIGIWESGQKDSKENVSLPIPRLFIQYLKQNVFYQP